MENLLKVGVVIGLGLLGTAPVRADTTLLSLTDMSFSNGTLYDLDFVATASTTTLSVAGYQLPFVWEAQSNSVTPSGGGANLLGGVWTFVPAPFNSNAFTADDGAVPALVFGGTTVGSYDTFSQTFATTPGADYVYEFLFTNGFDGALNEPSGLLVSVSGAVPEPSTWAMMLLGFAGLGYVEWRGRVGRRVKSVLGT